MTLPQAHVICLPDTGRRTNVVQRLVTPGYVPEDRIFIHDAVDAQMTPPPAHWTGKPAAWGCWASHMMRWSAMLASNLPSQLVLEEDAQPDTNMSPEALHASLHILMQWLPTDADMLYLGGQHLAKPAAVPGGWLRGKAIHRTHAYLVRNTPRIVKLHKKLCDAYLVGPAAFQHIDAALADAMTQGQLVVYCPRHWLFGQAAGISSIHGGDMMTERWWNLD